MSSSQCAVVHEDVLLGDAVLAELDDLQAEALLHESVLIVLAEEERLAVLDVDGVFGPALLGVDGLVRAVVEDDAVLHHLDDGRALVCDACLEHVDGAGCVSGDTALRRSVRVHRSRARRGGRVFDGA